MYCNCKVFREFAGDDGLIQPKVIVLLSSYNGAKYIEEQIKSILEQKYVNVELIIRDDGSNDGTVELLMQYAKLRNITVLTESNVGFVNSFLKLMEFAPDSDYYALADQDDIWYPDKLHRAVTLINSINQNIPILYGANQNYVDKDGNFIGLHFTKDMNKFTSIMNLVYGNYICGCTMVFNKLLLEKLLQQTKSKEIAYHRVHDTWMILIAKIYGSFIYDEVPVMDFRRHENNASQGANGINLKGVKLYTTRISNFFKGKPPKSRASYTAKILLDSFSNILPAKIKEELTLLIQYKHKINIKVKMLVHIKDFNKTADSNFIYFMKILLNWL